MPDTNKIEVGGIEIDVVRKNIVNLHLAVYPPDGRVRIASPLRLDDDAVRLFAVSRLAWIKKQQSQFAAAERQTKREFVTGESHYFEGNRYRLNLIERAEANAPRVSIRNKQFLDLTVRPRSTREQRERAVNDWYRARLREKLPALADKWQTAVGETANDWRIKQMKTKWGTCQIEARRIWLNLELTKKPLICLEYVIVHELLHLIERQHNERFVKLLNKFMPSWKKYRDELNGLILSYDDWNCEVK